MKFAIEIETSNTHIAPQEEIMDELVLNELYKKIEQIITSDVNPCFIINMEAVTQLTNEALHPLLKIQALIESLDGMVVFVNLQLPILQKVKQERLHLSLQIASSMEEAVELIHQENLSREMLNEI